MKTIILVTVLYSISTICGAANTQCYGERDKYAMKITTEQADRILKIKETYNK